AVSSVSNYPNPFDSRSGQSTLISYLLKSDSDVTMRLFDGFGRLIREMKYSAGGEGGRQGANEVPWDGSDDSGKKVSTGAYILVLEAAGDRVTRKIGVWR
ncbi:MAG: FlgD immunoglobulin-like domain containing protein, partial [Elusimicrobiota bacterium]